MSKDNRMFVDTAKAGADRERCRIRRAQRDALKRLRAKAQEANRPTMFNEIVAIDAATRAKRSKRK